MRERNSNPDDNSAPAYKQQEQQASTTTENQPQQVKIGEEPLDAFIQNLFSKLVNATRAANKLPAEKEYTYYKSSTPAFKQTMENQSTRLLNSISGFMHDQPRLRADAAEQLFEVDDVVDKFDNCIDLMDVYYENVDASLDDAKGENKKTKTQERIENNLKQQNGSLLWKRNPAHVRPQAKWSDVDNSNMPFVPKLKTKPNAIVPLEEMERRWREAMDKNSHAAALESNMARIYSGYAEGVGGEPTPQSYFHPYEPEIRSFQYTEKQLTSQKETLYNDLSDVTCTWVDTKEALQVLASKLDSVEEFAIDLEAHSYRSFQGFTCLMQISTRKEDFLVDTLELREELHILNSSFTNPKIVKVLHGSESDIKWLQRDFGLYIVNMFDTGQAADALLFPRKSLAYLLKTYCGVEADKKYQLADWRVRPLPAEMVKYAREDTHYLLYIYDRLRNELISRSSNTNNNLLISVLNKSRDLCLQRYEKELFTETSYLALYNNNNNKSSQGSQRFSQEQLNVFRALFKWRDHVARQEDESTRYILPNHMLFNIAEALPTDIEKLFMACSPVPPYVQRNASRIIKIISDALANKRDDDSVIFGKTEAGASAAATPARLPPTTTATPALSMLSIATPSSRPMADTHLQMQSPVLTTDQLYQTAGWVDSLTAAAGSTSIGGVLDFSHISSDDDLNRYESESDDSSPIKSRRIPVELGGTRPAAAVATAKSSSLFGSLSDEEDDEDLRMEVNNILDDEKDTREKLEQIRSSINLSSNSFVTPIKRPTKATAKTTTATTTTTTAAATIKAPIVTIKGFDDQQMADQIMLSAEPTTPANTKQQGAAGADETPPDERVPKSLNEIYKLSKKNRKRNKEKKKLKEDSVADPTPAFPSPEAASAASNGGGGVANKTVSKTTVADPAPAPVSMDSDNDNDDDNNDDDGDFMMASATTTASTIPTTTTTNNAQRKQATKDDKKSTAAAAATATAAASNKDATPLEFMRSIGWVDSSLTDKDLNNIMAQSGGGATNASSDDDNADSNSNNQHNESSHPPAKQQKQHRQMVKQQSAPSGLNANKVSSKKQQQQQQQQIYNPFANIGTMGATTQGRGTHRRVNSAGNHSSMMLSMPSVHSRSMTYRPESAGSGGRNKKH